ncbi:TonB-dependent receptor [Myroides odoratimimus]|uniref:TonB-dependent receptor n=1 Tax=Myroides odoratimimus TaxID=76832 RepID=UPI0025763955|nr:TonB-dependent receptor [Myroides odoratimimus]MDM1530881.1 TonB-dependent receptor [Myroides odoratimimus]
MYLKLFKGGKKLYTPLATALLFLHLLSAENTYAQQKAATPISIQLNQASITDVFNAIKKQSNYTLIYSDKVTALTKKVDMHIDAKDIKGILDYMSKQYGITYQITGSTISVKLGEVKTQKIKGIVMDEQGLGVPGATVILKGTDKGVSTDLDGNFALDAVVGKDRVQISFIGYKTVEVIAATNLKVALVEDQTNLDEVVVVGYGKQKRVNVTGAVDQVGAEVFKDRPVSNVAKALQGEIGNLNLIIGDGKPTRSATFNVRGTTSIGGGGNALVLIDGIPGDPSLLNTNDIESVSVLKDAASAAIYGARGSFGVVLITTKASENEKSKINFSTSFSVLDHTVKPDLVTNGYQWAKQFDDAYYSWNDYKMHPSKANSVFPFSMEYLQQLKEHDENPSLSKVDIDPVTGKYVYYGNTDWMKELYADMITAQEYNLSASGGGEKASYYLSGRINSQDGIFRYNPDKFNMYNLRGKGSLQATSWLKLENNFEYAEMDYFFPILNHPSDTPVWRRISDEAFPVAMMFNPDGTLTHNAAIVFGSFVSGGNYSDTNRQQLRNTTSFVADVIKDDLKLYGDFTFRNLNEVETKQYTPVPYSTKPGELLERGENKLEELQEKTTYKGMNLYAEYKKQFGSHYLKGLVGYNYEKLRLDKRTLERNELTNSLLPDFGLATGENIVLKGGGYQWATLGAFFRLNYNFREKYFIEVNGRYDGSSKFPQNQQWGFFPSTSVGYRLSQENFWQNSRLADILPELKFRASYGSLGNGNISPYQYLETMSVNQLNVLLNGKNPLYTNKPNVIPNGLTWEKATTFNIGFDTEWFNRRLTTSFDWYKRVTTDMYTQGTPLPQVFGATEPKGNYADLETKGWELSIAWRDKINFNKPLTYKFRFILSDNQSKITKFNNPTNSLDTYYKGMKIGEIWGFENAGYFIDQNDINNHADQSYIRVSAANILMPGDIKFADLNGDGVINIGDNTVDNPGDRKIIGNSAPRFNFGFNTDLEWNNFFVSAFFQGVGKRDFWPGADNSLFWGAYNRPYSWHPTKMNDMMWSEENPDAYFPRMRGYVALNNRGELQVQQSKYIQNAAYIRLKNLTIGYNFPKQMLEKNKIESLRIFFSGQNLWTYSPMFRVLKTMDPEVIDGADPELSPNAGNGMRYPMLKTFSLGIDITF